MKQSAMSSMAKQRQSYDLLWMQKEDEEDIVASKEDPFDVLNTTLTAEESETSSDDDEYSDDDDESFITKTTDHDEYDDDDESIRRQTPRHPPTVIYSLFSYLAFLGLVALLFYVPIVLYVRLQEITAHEFGELSVTVIIVCIIFLIGPHLLFYGVLHYLILKPLYWKLATESERVKGELVYKKRNGKRIPYCVYQIQDQRYAKSMSKRQVAQVDTENRHYVRLLVLPNYPKSAVLAQEVDRYFEPNCATDCRRAGWPRMAAVMGLAWTYFCDLALWFYARDWIRWDLFVGCILTSLVSAGLYRYSSGRKLEYYLLYAQAKHVRRRRTNKRDVSEDMNDLPSRQLDLL